MALTPRAAAAAWAAGATQGLPPLGVGVWKEKLQAGDQSWGPRWTLGPLAAWAGGVLSALWSGRSPLESDPPLQPLTR